MANPNRLKSWRQSDLSWLTELQMLLARRADLGIGADAAAMSLDELRGVYRYLSRLQRTSHLNIQAHQCAAEGTC